MEAELCSSTSRNVCELHNNGRVFGRPKILKVVLEKIPGDRVIRHLRRHQENPNLVGELYIPREFEQEESVG